MVLGEDPFSELQRLQRDIDRVLVGNQDSRDVFPAVNVWASNENVIVTAELPGMSADSIDISVQGDQFTLQGERMPDETSEDVVCHRLERGAGKFTRVLHLPYEVDSGKVIAKYHSGVLVVTLPRTETSKSRKIIVNA